MARNFYFNSDLGDAIDEFVNNIMKDVEGLVDQESVDNKVREFQSIITDSGLSAAQNSYRKKRESNKTQVKKQTKKQTNVINSSFSYSSKSDGKGTDIKFRKNTDINLSMSLLKWFQIVLLVNLIFSLKEDYGFGTWIVLAVLLTVAVGLNIFLTTRTYLKNLGKDKKPKEKAEKKPSKSKDVSLSVKKNISATDLKSKLDDLIWAWTGKDGEESLCVPYLEAANTQLGKMSAVKTTFKALVEDSDVCLDEISHIIDLTEEELIRNIVSMINHIRVELSIDGFDSTIIKKYIDNNDLLIGECSNLLKASLLYMDGRNPDSGIKEYIDSMIQTLEKLKKEGI